MEQGHDAERHVAGGQVVGLDDVLDGCGEIPVRQRHPLGAAGRPAGVQHQCHVVGVREDGYKTLAFGLGRAFGP